MSDKAEKWKQSHWVQKSDADIRFPKDYIRFKGVYTAECVKDGMVHLRLRGENVTCYEGRDNIVETRVDRPLVEFMEGLDPTQYTSMTFESGNGEALNPDEFKRWQRIES